MLFRVFLPEKGQDGLAYTGAVHGGPFSDLGVDHHGACVVHLVDVDNLAVGVGGQMDGGAVFVGQKLAPGPGLPPDIHAGLDHIAQFKQL